MNIVPIGEFRVMRRAEGGDRPGHWFYLVAVAADSLEEDIDGRAIERWLDGDLLAEAAVSEVRRR